MKEYFTDEHLRDLMESSIEFFIEKTTKYAGINNIVTGIDIMRAVVSIYSAISSNMSLGFLENGISPAEIRDILDEMYRVIGTVNSATMHIVNRKHHEGSTLQ